MPIYWIGVDEAGYGARLGPMVVSASAWVIDQPDWNAELFKTPEFLTQADQWSWYAQFMSGLRTDSTLNSQNDLPLKVADSKKVYQAGHGINGLQNIVTSLLAAIEGSTVLVNDRSDFVSESADANDTCRPNSSPEEHWQQACHAYAQHVQRVMFPNDLSEGNLYWWNCEVQTPKKQFDTTTPSESLPDGINAVWQTPNLRPLTLASSILSELQFNQGLEQYGNKANMLSATSMLLAKQVLDRCPSDAHVIIDFDRHGGRKRYLPLLVEYFAADWLSVIEETPLESTYYWDDSDRRVYFRFTVDGERRYPVAAASLASKYARELGMACVNAYWQNLLPGLPETAGYPVDAARMLDDIQKRTPESPVEMAKLWRNA